MKTRESLATAQRQMQKRQQQPRGPGRPPLAISPYELLQLWARGYSPRGMAIHCGCDERTIMQRLGEFFPDGLEVQFLSDHHLYHLAMNSDDAHCLNALLRRDERRAYRRTGKNAAERFHTEVMEYEYQQRRKFYKAQNSRQPVEGTAGANENEKNC